MSLAPTIAFHLFHQVHRFFPNLAVCPLGQIESLESIPVLEQRLAEPPIFDQVIKYPTF